MGAPRFKSFDSSREISGVNNLKIAVKPKQKGWSAGKISVSIPKYLFESKAYRELNPFEHRIMTELLFIAKARGTDVPLGLSVRRVAETCKMSIGQASQTFRELEKKGFIKNRLRGYANSRERISSGWSLTCLPYQGDPPTCDYNRIHDKAEDIKRLATVTEIPPKRDPSTPF
jgi:hypothetical protein